MRIRGVQRADGWGEDKGKSVLMLGVYAPHFCCFERVNQAPPHPLPAAEININLNAFERLLNAFEWLLLASCI